jgi:hypothetical protein
MATTWKVILLMYVMKKPCPPLSQCSILIEHPMVDSGLGYEKDAEG